MTTVSTNYIPSGTFIFENFPVESYPGARAGAFEISMQLSEEPGRGIWTIPPASLLLLQVDTLGRSMAFRIRSEGNSGTLEERTQRVPDRAWLDLGTIPAGLKQKRIRVESVSGEPFSFRIPVTLQKGDLRELIVHPVESATSTILPGFSPRYRIVEKRPVPPSEALARILFFPSSSTVLLVSLLGGLAAVTLGPVIVRRRPLSGVLLALAGVALLHASLRPPLRGEDEVAHVGTVEAVVWNPALLVTGGLPQSLDPMAAATGLSLVQFDTDEIVPVSSAANRRDVRAVVDQVFSREAAKIGGRFPDQGIQSVQVRSRLYYPLFRFGGSAFRRLGLLERFSAYRIVSTLLALAVFAVGAGLLRFGRMPDHFLILYGCAGLLPPYFMSVLTTVSNYSLAIGCGFLLAAAVVVLAISARPAARGFAAITLTLGGWTAVWVWTDFLMLAPLVTLVSVAAGLVVLERYLREELCGQRRWLSIGLVVAILGGGSLLAYRSTWPQTSKIESLFSEILSKRPVGFPRPDSPIWFDIVRVIMLPVMLAAAFGLLGLLGRRLPEPARDRLASGRSALGLAIFLGMFFVTPFTTVPFVGCRFEFWGEVLAHWNAFWSTAFSLSQDTLSWKMYWGVFGWADTKYPDLVYAVAKWACVALFLGLPILCRKFQRERPWISAALLVTSGLAVTFAVATNTLRYFQPSNPWGRFILPWIPLAVLPALSRVDWTPKREAVLRWIFALAIAFHVWTAIWLIGTRYYIQH